MLASRIPPTVSFALKSLQILEKKNKLDAQALFDAIGPAMWNRHKGTVEMALQMLEHATRKSPKTSGQIGRLVAEALSHESPDVHALAVNLLEKHAQAITAEAALVLRERLPNVSASQRSRLQKLLAGVGESTVVAATDEKASSTDRHASTLQKRAANLERKWRQLAGVDLALSALERDSGDISAIDFDSMTIPRLDPNKRIEPLENLDALIDAFLHVIEDPSDPMEVERVLDGVSRFCDQKPDDFEARTGPLRKRTLDRLSRMFSGPFVGCGILADLCGVARAWLCDEMILPEKEGAHRFDKTLHDYTYANPKSNVKFFVYHQPTPRTFLSLRALALAKRSVAGMAAPLLATPTHAPGWIDPRELVRRAEISARNLTSSYCMNVRSYFAGPPHPPVAPGQSYSCRPSSQVI